MGLDTEWFLASRSELRLGARRMRDFADLHAAIVSNGTNVFDPIRGGFRSDGVLLRHLAFWQVVSPTLGADAAAPRTVALVETWLRAHHCIEPGERITSSIARHVPGIAGSLVSVASRRLTQQALRWMGVTIGTRWNPDLDGHVWVLGASHLAALAFAARLACAELEVPDSTELRTRVLRLDKPESEFISPPGSAEWERLRDALREIGRLPTDGEHVLVSVTS
jgi:hypothetical protein